MDVVVTQQVAAEPSAVFASWTSAEELATWWWPQIPDTTYAVDARVGGAYEIISEAAGFGVRGQYLSVDTPTQIVKTWEWLTEGTNAVSERVTVGFAAPSGGGTLVTVTHEVDESVTESDNMAQGWQAVLMRLAERFAPPV